MQYGVRKFEKQCLFRGTFVCRRFLCRRWTWIHCRLFKFWRWPIQHGRHKLKKNSNYCCVSKFGDFFRISMHTGFFRNFDHGFIITGPKIHKYKGSPWSISLFQIPIRHIGSILNDSKNRERSRDQWLHKLYTARAQEFFPIFDSLCRIRRIVIEFWQSEGRFVISGNKQPHNPQCFNFHMDAPKTFLKMHFFWKNCYFSVFVHLYNNNDNPDLTHNIIDSYIIGEIKIQK